MTTTYVGIVRDHSASMRSIKSSAQSDYNVLLDGLKQEIFDKGQDGNVTVVECGYGSTGTTRVVETCTPLKQAKAVSHYDANGSGTPLWDSVGAAITEIENNVKAIHANDPTTAYLVMVITDGEENRSTVWDVRRLQAKLKELQATDKWTFVFRVPRGYAHNLTRMGIPAGNIMEWEQTTKDMERSTAATGAALGNYFAGRSKGINSQTRFYADLGNVSVKDIKQNLNKVTGKITQATVPVNCGGRQIRDVCNEIFGEFITGRAFYQLTKTEEVQPQKIIAIRDKVTNDVYAGVAARNLLGLPLVGYIKLSPTSNDRYDVFVQSTSVNRKILAQTGLLYFNEGVPA